MSIFQLYLLTLLPSLVGMFMLLTFIVSVLILITALLGQLHDRKDDREIYNKSAKSYIKFFIMFLVIGTLIPSEKQLYTIAGGYVATNTKGVQELPENIIKAANDFLKSLDDKGGE